MATRSPAVAIVTGAVDGSIKLWDAQTGACLGTLRADGPYAGMIIAGATGLTKKQRSALKALGAVEDLGLPNVDCES